MNFGSKNRHETKPVHQLMKIENRKLLLFCFITNIDSISEVWVCMILLNQNNRLQLYCILYDIYFKKYGYYHRLIFLKTLKKAYVIIYNYTEKKFT